MVLFRALFLAGLLSAAAAVLPATNASAAASPRYFAVKGVVKSVQPDGKTIEIRHEAIPNYMPSMTMPFDVKNTNEVAGLKPGDSVSFRLAVTDDDSWVDQLHKLNATNTTPATSASGPTNPVTLGNFHRVPDVDPLNVGDTLPVYHFTNQLGEAVSTAQFKGDALALTFIFTRCPLPNFCPRMSGNFEAALKLLKSNPSAPKNWHLLTISFDPAFDTPAVLKDYAARFGADPEHWSFLTGDPEAISAISTQFGQFFWQDEGAINHNLRTVVIDANGKVQKIFQGNNWTPEELVSEIEKAAKANLPR